MAAYHLKITKSKAIESLKKQIGKGLSIAEKGLEMIKEQSDYAMKRNQADMIKVEYEQWEEITYDKLKEIFVSTSYPYNFREHSSSKIKLVNSSWQPDVQYYVENKLIPKVSYLKILLKNIEDFEEIPEPVIEEKKQVKTINGSIPSKENKKNILNYDFEKITFPQLFQMLSISQIIKIISALFVLLSGAFFIGQSFSNWNLEKENKALFEENTKLKMNNSFNKDDSVNINSSLEKDSISIK